MTGRAHSVSRGAGILLIAALFSTSVAAETIRVTSGYFLAEGDAPNPGRVEMDLAGTDGFTLKGTGLNAIDGNLKPFNQCIVPECTPGTPIDLLTQFAGSAFHLTSVATYKGVAYPNIGDPAAPSVVALGIEFNGIAIGPPWAGGARATASAPFTFSGVFGPGALVPLTGRGTATLGLAPDPGGETSWRVDGLRFDFSDAEPVPEPATLTLIASGLAAAIAARRRRRQNA